VLRINQLLKAALIASAAFVATASIADTTETLQLAQVSDGFDAEANTWLPALPATAPVLRVRPK